MHTIEQTGAHLDSAENDREDKFASMPPLFTISEVADYLKVSTATIYRLMHDGTLVGVRVGSSLRFTRKNIEDFLESCAVDADV